MVVCGGLTQGLSWWESGWMGDRQSGWLGDRQTGGLGDIEFGWLGDRQSGWLGTEFVTGGQTD